MQPKLEQSPAVASTVDSSPFEALLDREHVSTLPLPESTPTPVQVQSKPEPKQTVLVWIEKRIVMEKSACAICGKVLCGCTPRTITRIEKVIRYQVEQK